jgi:hypothetical protein
MEYVVSQYHVGAKPIAGSFWSFEGYGWHGGEVSAEARLRVRVRAAE